MQVCAPASPKTPWAPPCNRQPSNIIIIVCNILWRCRLPPRSTIRPRTLDSDRQRPRAVQVASFAAKTASRTSSAAENETVWKEQTRLRESTPRPQKRTGDIADTCAASSSGRNRSVRAGLSSKPSWAPLCNRQPSNYIIIICNYSISSNDRSPPNNECSPGEVNQSKSEQACSVFENQKSLCKHVLSTLSSTPGLQQLMPPIWDRRRAAQHSHYPRTWRCSASAPPNNRTALCSS